VYASGMHSGFPWAAATAFLALGISACSGVSAGVAQAAGSDRQSDATRWVYYNGSMRWDGSWDWGVTSVNYQDTTGVPLSGKRDIEVRSQKWGGWQPFFHADCQNNINLCFDTSPYKYLIFSAKPTAPGQMFDSGFMSAGDSKDGIVVHISAYCSGGNDPPINEWETCKVPLSAYELTNARILKFMIQDQSGLASNRWYIDNVGFTAN
jgi:hypothetical protein